MPVPRVLKSGSEMLVNLPLLRFAIWPKVEPTSLIHRPEASRRYHMPNINP